ncbi:Glycosyltransferase family 4 protein [Rhodovastum atsumiense]|uniref:Glycosyltransferase family 4 protein n=1 Tax=Rhodovastum atsumiense TaxID=504468 RepID=A0A5M6IQX5_9PROT|nr:glycosyltransferase family 4 protein [Rhodovastum atsumiense]KAA5609928.1 glycosyltransferase family 4 protein [Rhodovastum atsumiense]CAH2604546.1 Glycosyltransferase family 4 protein [Rhodovastum atsumiense]
MREVRRTLLTGDAVGGVWRYALVLAQGLAERGVETMLAVLGPPPSPQQMDEAAAVPGLRVVPTGLPLDWTAVSEAELRETGAALAGMARRAGVDSVHLHTPALAAEVPWSVPVVAVAHSCVGTWWRAVRGGPMPADLAWRAAAVGRGLAEADMAMAPTRSFALALGREYRPGRRITVIHNGTEPPTPPPAERCAAVLSAGRLWDEGKNFAALDRVAGQVDFPILAAGPLVGPTGARFTPAHLHWLGVLPQATLAHAMAQATVFCAPSRYEPFGLAVLEAAQSGMALALADIPVFRELWDGAALFFHPDDDAGLAEVLDRLIGRPENVAIRARERATRYRADTMVEAVLAAHRDLVAMRVS